MLESMDAVSVFAAWLEGKSLRRQVERDVELKRMSRATANEVVAQGIKSFNFLALGSVADGDRLAHITYRYDADFVGPFPDSKDPVLSGRTGAELELMRDTWGREHPLTVMARRQRDGTWLLVADADFLLVGHGAEGFGA
jgi:hypothetical protein